MQDFFLLDSCSIKDSRTTQSSLESGVTLLTSSDVSDPSTQGCDGGPAVSACASFIKASHDTSWSTSTMTDGWHGCL